MMRQKQHCKEENLTWIQIFQQDTQNKGKKELNQKIVSQSSFSWNYLYCTLTGKKNSSNSTNKITKNGSREYK